MSIKSNQMSQVLRRVKINFHIFLILRYDYNKVRFCFVYANARFRLNIHDYQQNNMKAFIDKSKSYEMSSNKQKFY